MHLQIYALIPQTRTLGFATRFAIWVQGCPFDCQDCMTPNAIPFIGGESIPIDTLIDTISTTPDIEGITLTGGEPFTQAAGLTTLITGIRTRRDIGVIIYTGYKYRVLQQLATTQTAIKNLLNQTDLLIDGLYVARLNDGLSLRGSSNQRIWTLTDRYQSALNTLYQQHQRPVEIHLLDDAMMLVGIPGADTLQQWQQLKTAK